MAQVARLMSQGLSKLKAKLNHSGSILYFTNQIRDSFAQYGPQTETSGGHALKFYASVRVSVKRTGTMQVAVMEGGKSVNHAIANNTHIQVVKNKVAPPFQECDVIIRFGQGVSKLDEILDIGPTYNVIEKSGAYLKFRGQNIGQGRENAIKALVANPALTEEIYALVAERILTGEVGALTPVIPVATPKAPGTVAKAPTITPEAK